MDIPHTIEAQWPTIGSSRFAQRIRTGSPEGCSVGLIGLPDDLGISLNGGRPGARFGPRAFRAALARYGASYDAQMQRELTVGVFDAGDVAPAGGDSASALHETHERVTKAAGALHEAGLVVVAIGGGHDLTYPSVRALAEHTGAKVRGVNIDPHLDVREEAGSGMPFRALIEGGHLDTEHFGVIGVGRFANAAEHVRYLAERGATITTIDDIMSGKSKAGDAFGATFPPYNFESSALGFVSIDLDSIDGAYAPGVSAVNPMGLRPEHVVDVARYAGLHPAVRHLDIMELSPPHDEPAWDIDACNPGRTARLAVLVFLTFVASMQDRPA